MERSTPPLGPKLDSTSPKKPPLYPELIASSTALPQPLKETSFSRVLKLYPASESPGGFTKTQIAGPTPSISDLVGLGTTI